MTRDDGDITLASWRRPYVQRARVVCTDAKVVEQRQVNAKKLLDAHCSVLRAGEGLARQVVNPNTSYNADGGLGWVTEKNNSAGILDLVSQADSR